MITYVVGDLFQSPAQVLVNPVNTVGSMNRGLPLRFRRFYPDMYEQYRHLCATERFHIGQLWLYKTPHKWIMNLPTKADWRDASRREYVDRGLLAFVMTYAERGIRSVSFPMLGAGLDGLDWQSEVRPLMERYLDPLPLDVYVHLYEAENRFAVMRDFEQIKRWLYGVPQYPLFETLWADLLQILRTQGRLLTLGQEMPVRVHVSDDEQQIICKLPDQTVFNCTRGLLAGAWEYAQLVGYVYPQDLPGTSRLPADLLISLLTRLDYLHPVWMSRHDETRQIGMQLIPPVSGGASSVEVA